MLVPDVSHPSSNVLLGGHTLCDLEVHLDVQLRDASEKLWGVARHVHERLVLASLTIDLEDVNAPGWVRARVGHRVTKGFCSGSVSRARRHAWG